MNYEFVKYCTGKDISDWLKHFSEIVESKTLNIKNYKRIEYPAWREIKKFSESNEVTIFYKTNFNTKKYEICFSSLSVEKDIILTEENDFARFLIEEGVLENIKGFSFDLNCWENNYKPIITPIQNINTQSYNDYTITATVDSVNNEIKEIQTTLKDLKQTIKKETNKEMITTTSNVFNFDFGPLNGTGIRMSMYGFAIPNEAGKYVAYDADNDRIMDVQILNFNCDGIFYKVPKALNKVAEGDVVFHNGTPVFVEDTDDNRLIVIDPKDGTEKTIMPARSPFGFDYITTLVSLMDGFCDGADPDEDNPFGKMLPFLFMRNTNNSNDLLPLMFMANGEMDFSNPLMLLAMGGGKNFDTSNPLVLMALMKSFNK